MLGVSRGMVSQVCRHEETLGEFDPVVFGVNAKEPFFLFERGSDGLEG